MFGFEGMPKPIASCREGPRSEVGPLVAETFAESVQSYPLESWRRMH